MRIHLLWIFLVAACGSLSGSASAAGPIRPPNLIFILTDDQRWNTLGCAGDPNIQTPHLDRLARQGVRFQNHFVTTSICCVSRASILTGQYERRHRIGDFATPLTPDQWAQTYPALLRQNGYRTGFIGKFGVGDEKAIARTAMEFDYWGGLPGQGGLFFIDPKDPTRTHATARMGGQALEFLRGQPANKPFCLSISFTAPHARDRQPREFQPDLRDESMYTNTSIPHSSTATEAHFQALPGFVQASEGRTRWRWRFDTPEKFQQNAKDYYRLISGIDREVGRIVAELQARQLADNTVIIFTSDNGFFLGDRGLSDKWFMYEESLRTPLIIFDPRAPSRHRGRVEKAMTLNVDLAPTLVDLAGITPAPGMQGRSLAPFLRNKGRGKWRSEFFYEHHYAPQIIPPSEGVRTERWAYIRWLNSEPTVEELYDLRADPLEEHNLASSSQRAGTLRQMRELWQQFRTELR
jgi:arylsulfatase A-like enzyme